MTDVPVIPGQASIDNGDDQRWQHGFVPGGDHSVRDLREILVLVDGL